MPSNGTSNQYVVRDIPASVYANGVDGSAGNVISTPNIAAINGAAQFTVELWIRPVGTPKSHVLFDNSQAGVTDSFFLSMDANFSLFSYQTIGTIARNIVGTTARVVPNKWNLIAVTYNGSLISIFLNGSVIATLAASGTVGSNNGIFRIGSYHNGASSLTFLGFIHQPRIYTLGMTLQEHQDRYYNDETSAALRAALIMDLDTTIGAGTSLTDLSGNGNTGTMGASASWSTDSPFKRSALVRDYAATLSFNGSSNFVSLGAGGSIAQASGAFSVAAWFKQSGSPSGIVTIVGDSDVSNKRFYLQLFQNKLNAFIATTGTTATLASGSTYPINVWNHIVMTYDGANARAYINGVLDQTAICSGTCTASTAGMTIGRGFASARYFPGNISRVQYWTRAISLAEIQNAYHKGADAYSASIRSGMTGEWKLDEGSGSTAFDTFGNNNGTITGATWSPDAPMKKGLLARHYEASMFFNGASSVTALTKTSPTGINTGTLSRSVSAWVNLRSNALGTIFQFKKNSVESPSFTLGQLAGTYYFALDTVNGTNNLTMTAAQFSTNFPLNKWLHVAYVMTSTTVSLYVNGYLVISSAWGVALNTGVYDALFIGKSQTNAQADIYVLQGNLQDVRVHNGALTQPQIMREYLDGNLSSIIAGRWIGQEGAGTTVVDSVGANSMTNSGVTWMAETPIKRGNSRDGNLLKNSNFEYAPPFTAATTTITRYIDGTAGGSTTNDLFVWGIDGVNSTGSVAARFDTSNVNAGTYSMKVSTTAVASACDVRITRNTTAGNVLQYGIRVTPSTDYDVSFYMQTVANSGSATTGAHVRIGQYTSAGAGVTSNDSTKIQTTTALTRYTFRFTTSSTTAFILPAVRVVGSDGAGTLIMDAWFDDLSITPVYPEGRVPANGNLVKNFDFEVAPTFVGATTGLGRWIDGSVAGSTTNATYKWGNNSSNAVGSMAAFFDSSTSVTGAYSLKVSTVATGSTATVGNALSNTLASVSKFSYRVNPNTSYTYSVWMKTNYVSGDSSDGAYVQFTERNAAAGSITSTTTAKVKTTTGWTNYTGTFTTNAATVYLDILLFVRGTTGAATLIMDAWFDDIYLGQ